MVFLGYVTSSPKSRDYRTLIEKGRTKVNMNSFCFFFYELCYKAVLLRRQMINDDLLGSYIVHIPRNIFNGTNDIQRYRKIYQLQIDERGNPHTQCSVSEKKT